MQHELGIKRYFKRGRKLMSCLRKKREENDRSGEKSWKRGFVNGREGRERKLGIR